MNWDEVTYRNKASQSSKYVSVSGGDSTSELLLLNNISEKTFLTDFHWQITNS